MKVKSESEVVQLCLTLRDPMDSSLPGSSVHGASQARALEWVTLPSPTKGTSGQIKIIGKTATAFYMNELAFVYQRPSA